MPKKTVVVDYHACAPQECHHGICQAALLCERKVLTQPHPYEMPETKASMCLGCSLCMKGCPKAAIRLI